MGVNSPSSGATAELLHSALTHGVSQFELQRLQRMQRNRQVLIDMGVLDASQQLRAVAGQQSTTTKNKRQRCKGDHDSNLNPSRRSRRLAGHVIHESDHLDEGAGAGGSKRNDNSSNTQLEQRQQQGLSRPSAVGNLALDAYHAHNLHRLKSMSHKALVTRAWKITNVGKLQSFVQVLEEAGMTGVLQEAREALAALLGQG